MARKKAVGPHINYGFDVEFEAAKGDGSIDGYRATCACGFSLTNTVQFNANMDMRKHIEYMAKEGK